ncbi:hypothetical protein D3C71_2128040 [compost metagenome]
MTQAGQVAAIRLIGQPLLMQALRSRDQGRGCGAGYLDAFLAAVVFEQREYFHFVDQIGGKRHDDS